MNRPNPPPQLPKKDAPTQVFERWLYDFWSYVTDGSFLSDSGNLLAIRTFVRQVQPVVPPASDAQNILANQIFGG